MEIKKNSHYQRDISLNREVDQYYSNNQQQYHYEIIKYESCQEQKKIIETIKIIKNIAQNNPSIIQISNFQDIKLTNHSGQIKLFYNNLSQSLTDYLKKLSNCHKKIQNNQIILRDLLKQLYISIISAMTDFSIQGYLISFKQNHCRLFYQTKMYAKYYIPIKFICRTDNLKIIIKNCSDFTLRASSVLLSLFGNNLTLKVQDKNIFSINRSQIQDKKIKYNQYSKTLTNQKLQIQSLSTTISIENQNNSIQQNSLKLNKYNDNQYQHRPVEKSRKLLQLFKQLNKNIVL